MFWKLLGFDWKSILNRIQLDFGRIFEEMCIIFLRKTFSLDPLRRGSTTLFSSVFRIRILFILVSRIRIRFNETDPDPGSQKSAKIRENFHKSQPKSLE